MRGFLGAKQQPELLPPEEAFRIEVSARDAKTLLATLTPAPDYYLYRDRMQFSLRQPPDMTIVSVDLPKGESKADPTFGNVEVYHRPVQALITLGGGAARPVSIELLATYQGCNDPVGVCYPPIEQVLTVALPTAGAARRGCPAHRRRAPPPPTTKPPSVGCSPAAASGRWSRPSSASASCSPSRRACCR